MRRGCAGLLGVFASASITFSHARRSPPVGGITGQLESFRVVDDTARLRGWVFDVERDFPDISSPVSIVVDGLAVINTTANVSRPDLVPDKAPEPQHGIDVVLPPGLATKLRVGKHVVTVAVHREAEVDWILTGAPLCINSHRLMCEKLLQCACNQTDVAHVPASVAVAQLGTHTLLDAAGIDQERTNATFSLHRPVKDPNNPILREDQPWEDRLHMFGSLVQVSAKLWRIYYTVAGQYGIHNCIAESRDVARRG